MASLAWNLFWSQAGGPVIVFLYGLMHLAGMADRWKLRGLADFVRRFVTLEVNERVVGRMLGTDFRFLVTEAGGCAIDIDTEAEYDVAQIRFFEWRDMQAARAEEIYGPLQLAEGETPAGSDADGGG